VEADARRLLREALAAVESRQLPQEALAAVESRQPPQEALVGVESHWRPLEVSAESEAPALAESEVLPAAQESQVVDRTPQVSRYSGSLFRQPLLLASCPVPGSVGVVQNTQQKQEIQTHSLRSVNGPFALYEQEYTSTSALNKDLESMRTARA